MLVEGVGESCGFLRWKLKKAPPAEAKQPHQQKTRKQKKGHGGTGDLWARARETLKWQRCVGEDILVCEHRRVSVCVYRFEGVSVRTY